MKREARHTVSGSLLVADFQAAFISAATAEAAKHEAEHSENSITNYLESASSGHLLNPAVLANDAQTHVTRASLDAHIKKVQAQQMQAISSAQLEQLIARDQVTYHGRKVRVRITSHKDPVESLWLDKQSGYRKGTVKKSSVTGFIEKILLDTNALILKPTYASRLLTPALKNYIVYVTDPETLLPMVQLTLL